MLIECTSTVIVHSTSLAMGILMDQYCISSTEPYSVYSHRNKYSTVLYPVHCSNAKKPSSGVMPTYTARCSTLRAYSTKHKCTVPHSPNGTTVQVLLYVPVPYRSKSEDLRTVHTVQYFLNSSNRGEVTSHCTIVSYYYCSRFFYCNGRSYCTPVSIL